MDLKFLIQRSVDHALASIEDMRGPLTPFTFVLDANPDLRNRKLVLTRFSDELLEQALANARNSIAPQDAVSMYAIVWDGFATVGNIKYDAILVEAGAAGEAHASISAQPYAPAVSGFFRRSTKNKPVGSLLFVGKAPSRLAQPGPV